MLPVEVADAPKPSTTRIEVVLASGACLRFTTGTDVEYVAHLVATLGR